MEVSGQLHTAAAIPPGKELPAVLAFLFSMLAAFIGGFIQKFPN
jgi:hypothetical protein